jgi:hypothetical protein
LAAPHSRSVLTSGARGGNADASTHLRPLDVEASPFALLYTLSLNKIFWTKPERSTISNMRAIRFSLCALLVFCLVVNAVAASGRYTAHRRQDGNTLTLSSSDSQGAEATALSNEATKGASPTISASSSKSLQPDSTTTTTTLVIQTTSSPVSTTLNSPTPSATNGLSTLPAVTPS